MGKVFGLVSIHAEVIDEYMRGNPRPMGAQHIISNLFDSFKRSPPTRRQVGMYLSLNPNYELITKGSQGRLYSYSSSK